MNVRTCCYSTFYDIGYKVEPALERIEEESFSEIIQEEISHAVSNGDVDANGCPCITIIIDGAWNKRSFGHGYSASSGTAVINVLLIMYINRAESRSVELRNESKARTHTNDLLFG